MNNHNHFLIFFSFPTRLFNPCSALLLSFDRHLLRFQSFQELFLFSAILVLMYNFCIPDKFGHTLFYSLKKIPVALLLSQVSTTSFASSNTKAQS